MDTSLGHVIELRPQYDEDNDEHIANEPAIFREQTCVYLFMCTPKVYLLFVAKSSTAGNCLVRRVRVSKLLRSNCNPNVGQP